MERSSHVQVVVDLARVSANVDAIARRTHAAILAVVKADAYGLGTDAVAQTIADRVGGFCTFTLREAIDAGLDRFGRSILTLGPLDADHDTPERFLQYNARPAVWDVETAARFRDVGCAAALDTGMQRFAAPRDRFDAILDAGRCTEAFTHATRAEQAAALHDACAGRNLFLHAAGSSLLDDSAAHLDAVRPGLAIYRGAASVSTHLVDARDSAGPAGYGGFVTSTGRHGVILAGYRHGLRASGPCLINRERRRVVEVGMQSAFVEIGPRDRIGDEVVLLGDAIEEAEIAAAWGTSPQEALVRMTGMGIRTTSPNAAISQARSSK